MDEDDDGVVVNGVKYVFAVVVDGIGWCIKRTILGGCCEFTLLFLFPKTSMGVRFWIICAATSSDVDCPLAEGNIDVCAWDVMMAEGVVDVVEIFDRCFSMRC